MERGSRAEPFARRGRYYEMHTRQRGAGDVFEETGGGGGRGGGEEAAGPPPAGEGPVPRRPRALKE